MSEQTETLDKLYLEWSQFTQAKTARELQLENFIRRCIPSMTVKEQQAARERNRRLATRPLPE